MNILYSERVGLPTLSFVIRIITEVQMANKTEIKALEIGEIEGAMSSLSVAVAGLMTVVTASIFAGLM